MRIRALSVFEGVVYHCWPIDRSDPERPTLEVDALLRDGDADAEAGPLLVTVSDYGAMLSLGIVMVLGISACLVATLLVLPAVLVAIRRAE